MEKKTGNKVFASVSPSSATNIKCSQKSDYNIKCKETGSDDRLQNCQRTKTLARKQRNKPEVVPRQPEAVSRPPEVTPATQCHLKIIDHKKLANATLDYNISTDEISRGFALKYALREGNRYALRKDLRKMRLVQKVLLLKMRAKFSVDCTTEDRRQDYLNYFEQESLRAASRPSDSDDDFDVRKAI